MATAEIHKVGPAEYGLLVDLHNQIFRPAVDLKYFRSRLEHRHNVLCLVAYLEGRAAGFTCGYELRPSTYYTWLCGVVAEARRLGVASQLLAGEQAWARENGYEMSRFECHNGAKPIFVVAIRDGYDVVGLRWDSRSGANLVIFEKDLAVAE